MKDWLIVLTVASPIVCGCGRPGETTVAQKESTSIGDVAESASIGREDPQIRSILDQIVATVLTSPDLKDSREFYGTADDTRCALVTNAGYGIPWPEWYTPEIAGIAFVRATEGEDVDPSSRRLLGIRIDKFDLSATTNEDDFPLLSGPIQVTLLNAGADPEGVIVMGGARVYFRIEWENGEPQLVFTGLLDA